MKKFKLAKYLTNRLLIISIVVNIVLIAGVGTVYVNSQRSKKVASDQLMQITESIVSPTPSSISTPTLEPSPIYIPVAVPSPTPEPTKASEKALGLARIIYGLGNEEVKNELRNKFGDTDTSVINGLAKYIDENPSKMTEFEDIAKLQIKVYTYKPIPPIPFDSGPFNPIDPADLYPTYP